MIYIYNYQWQRPDMSAPEIETIVTKKHPIIAFTNSKRRNPSENHKLLWYKAITEDELQDNYLREYLQLCLDNDGELSR